MVRNGTCCVWFKHVSSHVNVTSKGVARHLLEATLSKITFTPIVPRMVPIGGPFSALVGGSSLWNRATPFITRSPLSQPEW